MTGPENLPPPLREPRTSLSRTQTSDAWVPPVREKVVACSLARRGCIPRLPPSISHCPQLGRPGRLCRQPREANCFSQKLLVAKIKIFATHRKALLRKA